LRQKEDVDVNDDQAFETLTASLATALDESLARHSAAVQKGNVHAVDTETEVQRQLLGARKKLQTLRNTWPLPLGKQRAAKPAAPRQQRKRRPRAKALKRGQMTPQGAYFVPILQILEEMGGRGPAPEVLDRVGRLMAGDLNEHDRAALKSGGIRWRTTAQWARNQLREQGLLAAGSRRGMWEITEQGRAYLREQKTPS
jgi:hypothetical protein